MENLRSLGRRRRPFRTYPFHLSREISIALGHRFSLSLCTMHSDTSSPASNGSDYGRMIPFRGCETYAVCPSNRWLKKGEMPKILFELPTFSFFFERWVSRRKISVFFFFNSSKLQQINFERWSLLNNRVPFSFNPLFRITEGKILRDLKVRVRYFYRRKVFKDFVCGSFESETWKRAISKFSSRERKKEEGLIWSLFDNVKITFRSK